MIHSNSEESTSITTEDSQQSQPSDYGDPDFQGTPGHERVNKAIQQLDSTFTPLKHQLQTSFDEITSGTKQKFIRKANSAVGAVLEAIAPGQGEQFREILQGQTSDLEESKLITCMRNAIQLPTVAFDLLCQG